MEWEDRTHTLTLPSLPPSPSSLPPSHPQHHAMDFLKMVEAQAMEWEDRKLQLINPNAGATTKGVSAFPPSLPPSPSSLPLSLPSLPPFLLSMKNGRTASSSSVTRTPEPRR